MLLRLMRYFTLVFVLVVGFSAQANTYSAFVSTPLASLVCLCTDVNDISDLNYDSDESEQPPISSSTRHSYEFTLTETSRYSSTGRLLLSNPEPDYQIEIELSIPPSPPLVIGYAVNINFYQHWLTRSSLPKSRISGWKDSNLLYSHREYPDVITFV